MRLYNGGLLIHQSHSDEGVIEVVDIGDTRSLHFGSYPRQSSMSLQTPHTLELTYTHAMMAALLLNQQPERVLIIGLGGGSLVKFLLHHFPHCHIDVVEYRQDVIDVAKHYFSVPENDPRLNITLGDGFLFVKHCFYESENYYDLVLVDAYDHDGMANSVGEQAFFDACLGILSANGIMSINLWGSEKVLFDLTMQRINQSFSNRTMLVPVEDKGNIIALATMQHINAQMLKQLRHQVDELEMIFNINLPKSLQYLLRQNRSFISRLLLP